jgi:hypothetical protein
VLVGHDLHRGRGDANRNPAFVTAVHELERLLLGEVGVGDDDLVDAVVLEQAGQVLEATQVAQAILGSRR